VEPGLSVTACAVQHRAGHRPVTANRQGLTNNSNQPVAAHALDNSPWKRACSTKPLRPALAFASQALPARHPSYLYFAAATTAAAAAVAAAAAAVAAAAASAAATDSAEATGTGAGAGAGDAKGFGKGIGMGITGTMLIPKGLGGATTTGGARRGGATTTGGAACTMVVDE